MDAEGKQGFREWLRRVIFQSDTRAGQAYDVVAAVGNARGVPTVGPERVEEVSRAGRGLLRGVEVGVRGLVR